MTCSRLLVCVAALLGALGTHAQSVGIGTATPASSAALEVRSTSRGLLLPRMSTAQMNAIANPQGGLLVYSTTAHKVFAYRAAFAGAITQLPSNSNTTVNASTYAGQSFTAPLGSITAYGAAASGTPTAAVLTVRVFAGTGTATLLNSFTASVTLPASAGPLTVPVTGITLQEGQVYSFALTCSQPTRVAYNVFFNPYAGGVRFSGQVGGSETLHAADDLSFEVAYSSPGQWVPLY